jgi:hypothetical protein
MAAKREQSAKTLFEETTLMNNNIQPTVIWELTKSTININDNFHDNQSNKRE